ncbi:MAG: nicotinate phosphoribosyltransferase [Candidatus Omnitrophica bacterium]|nr:nicotinate phosphoribosyltransferase [Candidatus Omnitrophota bacterium]
MEKWIKGKRLSPPIFNLPVEKIKKGWYSDKYFIRTREVLLKDNYHPDVVMQIFTREKSIVCGLDEAIAVLRFCAYNPEKLKIKALYDGDTVRPMETVMTIEGDYSTFAHLETVYLGVIARRTAVATAVKRVVDAARPKKVLFFPARFDHYSLQTGDGYAAFISGALGVSTDANAAWWGSHGEGTIPHGLIAAYDGDTAAACIAFDKYMPKDIKRIALVDFENDCVKTSLEVARALGKRLWGVRLDTALDLHDRSVKSKSKATLGVSPELVWNVRRALDAQGFKFVKIVISCGFDEEEIRYFNSIKVPYDLVGVGSAFFRLKRDFTADIVMVNGRPCAKVGRHYNPNPRLKLVKF